MKKKTIRIIQRVLWFFPIILFVFLLFAVLIFKWFAISNDAWIAVGVGLLTYYGQIITTFLLNQEDKESLEKQKKQEEIIGIETRGVYRPEIEFGFVRIDDRRLHYKHKEELEKKGIYGEERIAKPSKLIVEFITPKNVDIFDLEYCEIEFSFVGLPQVKRKTMKADKNSCYCFEFQVREDSHYSLSFDIQSKNRFAQEFHQPFEIRVSVDNKEMKWEAFLGKLIDEKSELNPILTMERPTSRP